MQPKTMQPHAALLFMTALAGLCPAAASAQSGSLLGIPGERAPLMLSGSSWCFQELEPPKQIQLNDIVTVIVKEASQFTSESEVDRRKRANIDAQLQDWIRLDNFDLKPAPQLDGDPRIRASMTSQLRSEMGMDTAELVQFRISAHVVDIRPNGNLVLEAHRRIKYNSEVWEQRLTGIVRREDVLPNNTVLSEKVADLVIDKCENGHVRDAYRRGWLLKWVDLFKPF